METILPIHIIEAMAISFIMVFSIVLTIVHIRLKTQFKNLGDHYQNLFCITEGCGNLKYYKFKHCAAHVASDGSDLDHSVRPTSQPEGMNETEDK